jgi:hypothetical protein
MFVRGVGRLSLVTVASLLGRRRCLSLASSGLGLHVATTRELFKKAQAVCFDVDSTVIMEEGIDVLAASKSAGEAVAELTRKAMGGEFPV